MTIPYTTSTGKQTFRPNWGKVEDWSDEDNILLYQGKTYIPPDEDLQRYVVSLYHDPPTMGHPGRNRILKALKRDFAWTGMTKFATQYVKGCAACQTCKVNLHPTKPGLVPIPHSGNPRPFQTITIDYITDLPPSKGPGD